MGVLSAWTGYVYLLIRTLLLSGFLASISTAIGLYAYRIYEVNPQSFVDAMDAIIKQPPPPIRTIQITAASGLIFAVIFYGEYIKSQIWQAEERTTGLVKFLAGVVSIVWVDIQMLRIDFYHWVYRNAYPNGISGIVIGQVISIVFVMIFMPIFRKLLKVGAFSPRIVTFSDKTQRVFNYIRYFLVSLLVILLTTYLSAIGFRDRTFYHYLGLDFPIVRSGIFLAIFGFTVLFHRPPKSLGLNRSFSFIRLILGVLSLLGVGFFYSQAPNSEMFLMYVLVASILSWLSYPIIVLLC